MPDLEFLGIGSAFCPELGNTSAYFWKKDTLYLIDCGSMVYAALEQRGILARAGRIIALITHMHADHVGSLGTLISHCKHVRPLPIDIVHPEKNIGQFLLLNGITSEQYRLLTGMTYEDENIRVRFFPVPHTKSINAYGMLLSDGLETVYYSGDAGDVPVEVWEGFLARKIARVYQDVSLTGKRGGGHGEYAWFAENCPSALKPHFYPIHLNQACRAQAEEDGFGKVDISNSD